MAIVNIYIDGFNLYYGALKRTPYKWLDLGKLAQTLLPADTIQELHYFTARVSSRAYNPSSAHDQGLYIRALKTIPNLHIKYGHFLTHSVPMYLTDITPAQKAGWTRRRRRARTLTWHRTCYATRTRSDSRWQFSSPTIPILRERYVKPILCGTAGGSTLMQ